MKQIFLKTTANLTSRVEPSPESAALWTVRRATAAEKPWIFQAVTNYWPHFFGICSSCCRISNCFVSLFHYRPTTVIDLHSGHMVTHKTLHRDPNSANISSRTYGEQSTLWKSMSSAALPACKQALGGSDHCIAAFIPQKKNVFLHSVNYKIAPHDTLVNEVGVAVPLILQLGKQSCDSEVQRAAQGHTVAQS